MAIEHGATRPSRELARLADWPTQSEGPPGMVQDLLTADDESAYLRPRRWDYDLGPPPRMGRG